MKKKSLSWAKQEKLRLRREHETRQEVHPVTELVEPRAPANARWQVFEWCVRIGNWQHVGYASTESRRKSLADGVRALGGKVRVDELTPQRPTTQSRGGRNIVVVRAPSAPDSAAKLNRAPAQPATAPDFRKSLLSSLSVWLSEVWKAKVDAELPVDQIRAVRDACKTAVQKRKGRSFRPSQPDPFAKFE
jgi:hypothetical protein